MPFIVAGTYSDASRNFSSSDFEGVFDSWDFLVTQMEDDQDSFSENEDMTTDEKTWDAFQTVIDEILDTEWDSVGEYVVSLPGGPISYEVKRS